MAEIVREVVEAGLTDEEVERAKRRMVAEVVYAATPIAPQLGCSGGAGHRPDYRRRGRMA